MSTPPLAPPLRSAARRRALGSGVAVLLLSFAASGCGADEVAASVPEIQPVKAGTLTVCTSLPYEPFEFEEDGETVGFDIDLVKEVAAELELDAVVLNTDFDQIQSGVSLNGGTCDVAIAGLTITGDRAKVLDFSSPYFNAAQALVVRRSSGISDLDDLRGKKVGVQAGTTGELYVTDNAADSTEIVTFEDAGDITSAMDDGQLDAAVYDNTIVGDVVSGNDGLRVATEFDTGEQYGMAVKKDGNVELLRTINDVLAKLRANGGYQMIYEKWFGSAPKS